MPVEVVESRWTYTVTLPNGEKYRVVCVEDGEGQLDEDIRIWHIGKPKDPNQPWKRLRDREINRHTEIELWSKVYDELQSKK